MFNNSHSKFEVLTKSIPISILYSIQCDTFIIQTNQELLFYSLTKNTYTLKQALDIKIDDHKSVGCLVNNGTTLVLVSEKSGGRTTVSYFNVPFAKQSNEHEISN
eukprot:UN28299